MVRELKYKAYLEKYKNCPKDCSEKDLAAYRWVHNPATKNDFLPVLLNEPLRALDDNDKDCKGYAVSLFKDVTSSKGWYIKSYARMDRPTKRDRFKANKGTHSAKITITKDDGVSDFPDIISGHFNFFEYKECNLVNTVSEILDNFA
jgi:hypothetical protein